MFPAIVGSEIISAFGKDRFIKNVEKMDPVTRNRAKLGLNVSSFEYIEAKNRLLELENIASRYFSKYDALISPTTVMQALEVDKSTIGGELHERSLLASANTQPVNIFGLCGISFPIHNLLKNKDNKTLPIGLQIICGKNEDEKAVEWKDANIHILNHGLHYASCVFEGERVYEGEIFKLEEHTDRLFYSAKRMGIQVPYTQNEINEACKNIVNIQKVKNGYVRPLIWRGSEMMAISAQKNKIHVAIATWEWGSYFDPELKLKGIKLNISSWRRPAPNTIPWDTKAAGLYMICTLSKHEAEAQGFTDSLMLDHEGNIAEATGANVFFKNESEELITPIPDSFLDGITRREVI